MPSSRMRKFQLRMGDVDYSVEICQSALGLYDVTVNGESFRINIADLLPPQSLMKNSAAGGAPASGPASPASASSSSSGLIKAAMPGTVIAIKVKPGDAVKPGDVLLTLETMKMENPVKSTREGKVRDIAIKLGKFVNVGDTLVVIE